MKIIPTNFSILMKIIPTKMSIPMKIMPTKFPQSSKIGSLNNSYTSNSHNFIPTQKNIQVKIHPTIPQATYNAKLHKPSTMSKLHNTKQLNNSRIP